MKNKVEARVEALKHKQVKTQVHTLVCAEVMEQILEIQEVAFEFLMDRN